MAVITNTFTTANARGNREDLSDTVSMLTPSATPFLSMIGRGTASNTKHEWEIDTLRAPISNIQLEGDQYTYNAQQAAVRVANQTQIMRESWVYSRTQGAMNNAGNWEKKTRAKLKAGLAIKRDAEVHALSNQVSTIGPTRQMGGLPTWITSNVSRGAGGANGGFNVGTGLTVAATNGTSQRAFTQALLDTVLASLLSTANGGATDVMGSIYIKGEFVKFMSNPNVAVFRKSVDNGDNNRIVSNADWYDSPYGTVKFTPNYLMTLAGAAVARNVFALNTEVLSMDYLRPINDDPDAVSNADADVGVMIGEATLKVTNEAGCGVIADVFGLTAST